MRKLVGVQRNKSFFLLYSLFHWARKEGCHGDEVGLSPTAWSGKSSSLLWHLHRLEETETMQHRNTGLHTMQWERGREGKAPGKSDSWTEWLSLRKPFISSFSVLSSSVPGLLFDWLSVFPARKPAHISFLITMSAQPIHATNPITWGEVVKIPKKHKHIHAKPWQSHWERSCSKMPTSFAARFRKLGRKFKAFVAYFCTRKVDPAPFLLSWFFHFTSKCQVQVYTC